MRVLVTRIEWDGTMQRRLVDTVGRSDASQWERLVARALAIRPLYRPVPERPLYHIQVNEWPFWSPRMTCPGRRLTW